MKTKLLIQIFLCSLAILTGNVILAQSFTKITEGPLVNDGLQANFCTWGDYDNDGDEDLFIANGWSAQQANLLFRNEGSEKDYTFIPVTEGSIVTDVAYSIETSWGDYDNDGDLDLFVVNNGWAYSYLYQNNGDGTFRRITEGTLVTSYDPYYSWTASWMDYDNDGYLDIFLGDGRTVNYLYKGMGDGIFTRITEGPIPEDQYESYGHAWADFDNDRDPDLFVDNNDGLQVIYLNNGNGNFSKKSEGIVLNDPDGMIDGGSWVDYDNDGDWDMVDVGQAIYRNEGADSSYKFTEITTGVIVSEISSGSGSKWADYDNDGDIDCFVHTLDIFSSPLANYLCSNNGDGTFDKIEEGDIVTDKTNSLSSAWTDYDNDGDMDLYVCNSWNNVNNLFYQNDNDNGNSWIKIKLKGTASNASTIGAVIKVKAVTNTDPVWQMRAIGGPNSFIAHFGLGTAAVIDSMVVQWPAGHDTVLTDVAVDQLLNITEEWPDGYLKADFKADTTFARAELTVQFTDISVADPDNPITSWSWDFDGDGTADSDEQNPAYTFTNPDGEVYDVSLVISNGSDADTMNKAEYIRILPFFGNLAPWGTATASSEDMPLFYAQKAIDGIIDSRWNSDYTDNEWLKVELDSVYNIGKVIIQWEIAYSSKYSIQTSMDDILWDTVYCNDSGDGDQDILLFTGTEAKYVKMDGFDRGTSYGHSIYEFEIYHSDGNEYDEVICPPTGIENNLINDPGVRIYPNPAGNQINIEFNQEITQNATIDLVDITGKVIYTEVYKPDFNTVTINLSELAKGMYLLRIRQENNVRIEKLIVY